MNFKHIAIVFKKEMKDAFRDRKSVITNILLPLILIPVMYYCMNLFMQGATRDVEENMKIAIIATQNQELAEKFTKERIIGEDKIQIVSMENEEQANQALLEGDIHCILHYSNDFFEKLENKSMSAIQMEYNSLKSSSEIAMQKLQNKVMQLNTFLAQTTLTDMNLSPEILHLISPEMKDVSEELNDGKKANEFMMMIIPMYLVIVIVTAGIPMAIDVVAGERERNTFEALFSTKANRLSILIGKYLAVLVFSIVAIIMSFIGLIIGIAMNPEMFSTGTQTMNLATILESMNMPVGVLLLILCTTITLAIIFAGIQIAISTWSKTVKEAQTYLSYMTFPAMIIGFASMFMGAGDIQAFMAYIPIFNTVCSLKMVLAGVINYGFLFTGIIINGICIILVTWFIIKMFQNEKVMIK